MTATKKKEIIDNILELLGQLAEDEENPTPQTTKSSSPEKIEMLTIKECTEVVQGLSEHTVRQLVKQGKVKSVRTGEGRYGKFLVNKADLLDYFQN